MTYHYAAINSPLLALRNENKCPHANFTLKYEGSKQGPCDVDVNSENRVHTVFKHELTLKRSQCWDENTSRSLKRSETGTDRHGRCRCKYFTSNLAFTVV